MSDCLREVIEADAILWLTKYEPKPQTSFITSLPDVSEFKDRDLIKWKGWFVDTTKLILEKMTVDGVAIFFQSDIKVDGIWIDKGYLCQKGAEESGHHLLFHKIMCRSTLGTLSYGRPAYSHMLAFSKTPIKDLKAPSTDVVFDLGEKTWERGMGINACRIAADFLIANSTTKTVVNPFCGEGSVLAVMNALGLDAVGIDRSKRCCEKAKTLEVNLDINSWIY